MNEDKDSGPRFWIEVPGADPPDREIEVDSNGVLIGRSENCDLVLHDQTVSRRHARIFPSEGFCYVEDLGSQNGTSVDGRKTGYECLSGGEVIELGDHRIIFHAAGSPMHRQKPDEQEKQAEEYREIAEEAKEMGKSEELPLHPLAITGMAFVGLGCWFWAFGLGAVVLGVLSFHEIRSREKYRGTALALAAIIGGLVAGGLNACARSGGVGLFVTRDAAAEQCKSNLTTIGEALRQYAEDHSGRLPDHLTDLNPDYVADSALLSCPSAKNPEPGGGYRYPAAGKTDPPPSAFVVLEDDVRHRNGAGGFALRANGEVEWLPARRLQMELIALDDE